jgi:hypothetical protein
VTRVSIGFVAHMGWATTASIVLDGRKPIRVIRTDRIQTADANDREALEPYHVAGGFHGLDREPRPADPTAVVRRGINKQRRRTLANIKRLAKSLTSQGHYLTHAGILVGRGRRPRSLEKILAAHTQIHIAEGIAVRDSIARALRQLGAAIEEIDRKSLPAITRATLKIDEADAFAALNAAAGEIDGPWRAEERLAALAAWLAAA